MTVDVPVAAANPLRFVQPVIAFLVSAGVVALAAGQLFGYQQILPDVATPVVTWLAPITAVLALTLPAAAVAVRPELGGAGGWPIVAAGFGLSILVVQTLFGGARGDIVLVWSLVVAAGFAAAVGGVMVAAAQAPVAEQIAIAAGMTLGLAGNWFVLDLLAFWPFGGTFARMMPYYLIIGLAVVASVNAFARPFRDAPRPGFVTVLVVVAVSGMIQLGHFARKLVVDEFRVSADGLASQRRIDTIEAFAEYSAIALAVVAGVILFWFAYRRGKVDLARWVVLGCALGGPSLVLLFGTSFIGPAQVTGHGVVVVLAAAAGVVLGLYADRFFAWDALGVVVAAVGMIIGPVSYRIAPSASQLSYLLIGGGFAFALASGLIRVMRSSTGSGGEIALSLLLGLVALLATADAIAPAAWLLVNSRGFDGFELGVPVTSLVAAAVLLALFGFRRAVERVRREIKDEAEQPPPPLT